MSAPVPLPYRAFLSYSHADTPMARRLHGWLEGFHIDRDLVGRMTAVGPIPRALRPVFRDREEFPAGAALAGQTVAALEGSAALVLLCTPASARSHHVNEEVRLWKSRHPDRPLIPIIADGQPGHPERECFPPALRFEVGPDGMVTDRQTEILAADLRETGDGERLAVAKVVARLIGLGTDEVFRRAERAQRQRQRRWIAGLSGVAIALAALAIWAEINRLEAVYQRESAERNFAVAKQGADALIYDVAQSLRFREGMRTETVRTILGRAAEVIDKLVASSGENPELQRSQAAMLTEFAITYAAQGDTEMQEQAARRSVDIARRRLAADPVSTAWQDALAISLSRLGEAFEAKGVLDEADASYRESLALITALVAAAPNDLSWQHLQAIAHDKLGNLQRVRGNLAEALGSHRLSLALMEPLAAANPANSQWQHDLATTYERVGRVLREQGSLVDALASINRSRDILDRLAKAEPGNILWQRELAAIHQQIGSALVDLGKLPDAEQSFATSRAIVERLAKTDPESAWWQRDLASNIESLGNLQKIKGRSPRRCAALRRATRSALASPLRTLRT